MTATTGTDLAELDSPREVLVFARESQVATNRAQADLMTAAVTWAEQHPPESITEAATWIEAAGDTGLPSPVRAHHWWRSSASRSSRSPSAAPPTPAGRWSRRQSS